MLVIPKAKSSLNRVLTVWIIYLIFFFNRFFDFDIFSKGVSLPPGKMVTRRFQWTVGATLYCTGDPAQNRVIRLRPGDRGGTSYSLTGVSGRLRGAAAGSACEAAGE